MFNYYKINGLIAEKKQLNKKITIAKMADGMGIALDALNKTKAGKSMPGADTLEKIAVYFGVDVNYFFDNAQSRDYKIPEQKPLVLNEQDSIYEKTDATMDKMLNKIFEQHTEIVELNVELERLKNECARAKTAQAG